MAAPVSGGAVRLAYPLSDARKPRPRSFADTLLLGSALAFLWRLFWPQLLAQFTARRLQRIVEFANKIAAGELTARIAETSSDEIGQVAAALDKTARHVEDNFAALQTASASSKPCSTAWRMRSSRLAPMIACNGQIKAWIACSAAHPAECSDRRDRARSRFSARGARSQCDAEQCLTARATSIVPARTFDVTAAPMPGGGAVAVLRDLTETERMEKTRRDFIANVSHELRTPLTSIQGYTETLLDGRRKTIIHASFWKLSARTPIACLA